MMNEPFLIPIVFEEVTYEFKARFERWGYSHRIAVLIDEITYNFEPDEEGGYRALVNPESPVPLLNIKLLRAISEKLIALNN